MIVKYWMQIEILAIMVQNVINTSLKSIFKSIISKKQNCFIDFYLYHQFMRNTKEIVPSSLGNKEFSKEIIISLVHDMKN